MPDARRSMLDGFGLTAFIFVRGDDGVGDPKIGAPLTKIWEAQKVHHVAGEEGVAAMSADEAKTRGERAPESRARLLAAFAAVYLVWGSTYLAIRYAVESIPPFLMGGVRFVVAGLLLYFWTRLRGATKPTRAQWIAATVTGVFLLLGGNGSVIWAEQHVASGIVALIVAIVPLWMVLLDWLRPRGTRPRAPVFVGLGLGLIGLALLIGPDAVARSSDGSRLDVGAALVPVLGSFLWAFGSIYSKYAARAASSQLATGMQMLAGGVAFLIASFVVGEPRHFDPHAVTKPSLLGFLYLLTFGSLVGFTAYIYLLRATTSAKASTYAYVNPVVAVFLGWAVADEPLTARTLVAAAIILGGVALITLANADGQTNRVVRSERTDPGEAVAGVHDADGSPSRPTSAAKRTG